MNLLAEAKCYRCNATAQADTFEQARKQLNHAVGLGRGIKCGDSYNCVIEVKTQPDNVSTAIVTPKTEIKVITPDVSPIEEKEAPKEETVSQEPKTSVTSEIKKETSEKNSISTESPKRKQRSSKKEKE